LCGKTTNLQWIHEKLPIKNKGKMLSLATETDRTLFFDFLPIELGTIRGMRTRIQLYTVPGQVFYNATRRMVLKGADCIVFVVDSQEPMLEANAESLENLRENLEINELDPNEIPLVIQYNKRDLPNALPIEILNERLNPRGAPHFEAVALKGQGVEETLKGVTGLVFRSLATKYGGQEAAAQPPAQPKAVVAPQPAPPVAAQPPAPRPPLNLQSSPEPAEELLGSLQLEPASDVGGDFDLGLAPSAANSGPTPVEELQLDEVEPPVEELHLEPEPPAAPAASSQVGKATLVRSADEAADLRRRIERTVSHEQELQLPAETIDDLQLEPEAALSDPLHEVLGTPEPVVEAEPIPEPTAEEFELATAGPMDLPAETPEESDEPLDQMDDLVVESAAPAQPRRAGLETLPPFDNELEPEPAQGGPLELAIPVEVRLQDGTARINIQLRLTLDLKLTK
jgi:signal recognition particle receptor subunit beta